MKKTLEKVLTLGLMTILCFGCKDDNLKPIEQDGTPPEVVTNIAVENIPGGAIISYTLPKDEDLLYVIGKYETTAGTWREFKSSFYTNQLLVEGFPDTKVHQVELFSVDKSGNSSKPITVDVQPKTPQIMSTLATLKIVPDFGGFQLTYENSSKADLAIHISTPDSTGALALANTFYTAREGGNFSLRGFDAEPRKFTIQIEDKWSNLSENKVVELTPIYEKMMDKTKFKPVLLPGDSPTTSYDSKMENIWDGKVLPDGPDCAAHTGIVATGIPKYFTFDMGTTAQLSRFSLQAVADDKHWFNDVTPKRYEIWGAAEFATDGSFTGWTKLATVTTIKPSGLPVGVLTEDDRVAGRIGDEVNFPLDLPKVRYIRLRCLENWSGNTNMAISEVTFWGNDR
jgi:hypothetical protein